MPDVGREVFWLKMNKNKIRIVFLSILLIGLIGGRYVSSYFNTYSEEDQNLASNETQNSETEVVDNLKNIYDIEFSDAVDTSDNPWGASAGEFDMEELGKCILLTPGTSVTFRMKVEDCKEIGLSCRLHPQVSSSSDGAKITVEVYTNDEKNLVAEQDFSIGSGDDWSNKTVKMEGSESGEIEVKISCNNSENENADWVIINEVLS